MGAQATDLHIAMLTSPPASVVAAFRGGEASLHEICGKSTNNEERVDHELTN